ncbi:MAG: hypothetical protein QOE77_2299 [Blastocatellia bacterium]|jgi:hypothetical protein|nr:hypothetical protein [Blastocatellia bacterium]
MLLVTCPTCGLNNKATHSNCIRCYSRLEGLRSFERAQIPAPGHEASTTIKLIAGGALLLVLLVMGAVLTFYVTGRRGVANRNAPFEAAIRAASEFNAPVAVEAGRYTFYNREASRQDQEATAAAYVLDSLGLLYIRTSFYSDVPTTWRDGKQIIDPRTGLVPFEYTHVNLELTDSGQTQSDTWEPYEVKKDGKVGWKVPLGERQLIQVMDVMASPDDQPLKDEALVSFTWRWKPNEIGKAFDRRSPSYLKPDKPKNILRNAFDVEINDSQATYWGVASVQRVNDRWEASRFSWVGTQGVKLSPNVQMDSWLKDSTR